MLLKKLGSFKLNSNVLVISLSILLLSVSAINSDFVFAGTPEEEAVKKAAEEAAKAAEEAAKDAEKAAEEAAKAAEEAAKDAEKAAEEAAKDAEKAAEEAAKDAEKAAEEAAQQAASDAESAAQQAASDAESAAQQAASDAESAAQQAASDEEIAAQEAALKKEKIKIFLSIKNNLSQIDQVKEKEDLDDNKPIKQEKGNEKVNTKISKLISSKDPESYAKKNGFDFHDGDTRVMINMNEIDDATLEKIKTLGTIEVSKGDQIQIKIPAKKISELSSISEVKNIKSTLPPIQNRDIVVDGRIIEDSIFSKKYKSKTPVNVAIIDLAFDKENQKISNNIIEGSVGLSSGKHEI